MFRPSVAVLAAVLLALVAATPAVGKVDLREQPRSLRLMLFTETGDGYAVWVRTAGHRQVSLTLAKGSASATYTTTGRVSRKGIEADFGELGEISVRFQGKPVTHPRPGSFRAFGPPPRRECRGRQPQQAFGTFRGRIEFAGENGYASVDTESARGALRRTYRRVCRVETRPRRAQRRASKVPSPLDQLRMDILTVGGEDGDREIFLQAIALPPDTEPKGLTAILGSLVFGGTFEHRDGVRIERGLLLSAGTNALTVSPLDESQTLARVRFPRPLEGSATLLQGAGVSSGWGGSLRMRLPGAGAVPLAGEGFSALLCQVPFFGTANSPCLRRAAGLLPELLAQRSALPALSGLAQGSGSHSQALADVRLSWSR